MLKKEEGKERERKWTKKNKQDRENYKENIGTKLISNTNKKGIFSSELSQYYLSLLIESCFYIRKDSL